MRENVKVFFLYFYIYTLHNTLNQSRQFSFLLFLRLLTITNHHLGGEFAINVRTAWMCCGLFGGAAQLISPGGRDCQLSVAREYYQG